MPFATLLMANVNASQVIIITTSTIMVFTLLINMIILIIVTIIKILCIQAMRELDVKICALRVILAKIVTRFRAFFLVLIVTHINRGPCYDYQTF